MNTNSPDLYFLAVEQTKIVVKTLQPLSKVRQALSGLNPSDEIDFIIKNEGKPSPAMIEAVGEPTANYFAAEYVNILAYYASEKKSQLQVDQPRETHATNANDPNNVPETPFQPQAEKPVEKTPGFQIPAIEGDVDPKSVDLIADEHILETKDSDKPAKETWAMEFVNVAETTEAPAKETVTPEAPKSDQP